MICSVGPRWQLAAFTVIFVATEAASVPLNTAEDAESTCDEVVALQNKKGILEVAALRPATIAALCDRMWAALILDRYRKHVPGWLHERQFGGCPDKASPSARFEVGDAKRPAAKASND